MIEVSADTPWWRARYAVERANGWDSGKDNRSAVVGFLPADFARGIPLHDEYLIKSEDKVVMVRLPCKPAPFWVPEQVKFEEWSEEKFNRLGRHIRSEPSEPKRIKLVQEQQALRSARPGRQDAAHPSLGAILRKYTSWRVAPGEVALVRPPDPGDRYVCFKCLNHLEPRHYVDDCLAPVTRPREWLRNKKQPHGVLKCTMEAMVVEKPADVLDVEWIDAMGVLWRRRKQPPAPPPRPRAEGKRA